MIDKLQIGHAQFWNETLNIKLYMVSKKSSQKPSEAAHVGKKKERKSPWEEYVRNMVSEIRGLVSFMSRSFISFHPAH